MLIPNGGRASDSDTDSGVGLEAGGRTGWLIILVRAPGKVSLISFLMAALTSWDDTGEALVGLTMAALNWSYVLTGGLLA